jgi:hypothetical protein
MKGYIHRIPADLSKEESTVEVDSPHILAILRQIVSGPIELVPMFCVFTVHRTKVKCAVFCNEEGKLKNLPYNQRATELWLECLKFDPHDVLVGDVVVVWGDDLFMKEL